MGRKAIFVPDSDIQAAINLAENGEGLKNLSILCSKVAEQLKVSPQWVYLKITKNSFKMLTQKGKKVGETVSRSESPKTEKKISLTVLDSLNSSMSAKNREKYKNTIIKAASGSLKAVVKLKCLDCSSYQQEEIRNCTITGCSLYSVKPY
jgi:hypothetical protein